MYDAQIPFIGLAIAIVGGGAMYIWHTISTLKEERNIKSDLLKKYKEEYKENYEKIESLEQELEEYKKEYKNDNDQINELRTELKFSNWQKNYNKEKHAEKAFYANELEKELEYTEVKLSKKEEVISRLLEYIHNPNRRWEVVKEIEADLEREEAESTGKVL